MHLGLQHVECFYPKVSVEKIRRGKRGVELEPLFPSYLFVQFDPETISFTTVRSTRGVAKFVMIGENPVVVPEDLIENIQLNQDTFEQREKLSDVYSEGETVQLISGEYEGLDAIFEEPDGEKRSFLLINLFHKQVKLSVSNTSIRRKN